MSTRPLPRSPTVERQAYWTTRRDYVVECQDCDLLVHSRSGQGTAAQHHDRTGHVVRVQVEWAIYYGEDQPRQRRWWKRG